MRKARILFVALAAAALSGVAGAQTLAPIPAPAGTTPTCAATEADEAYYLRLHGTHLPLCSTLRAGVARLAAPTAPAAAATLAPLLIAPAATVAAPSTTLTPAITSVRIASPAPSASTTTATGAPVSNVPACVGTTADQDRYESASGIRPPICNANGAPPTPTANGLPPLASNVAGAPANPLVPGATGAATASGMPASAPSAAPAGATGGAAPAAPAPAGGASPPPDAPAANTIAPQAAAPTAAAAAAPRPTREPDQLVLYWPDSTTLGPLLERIRRDFGLSPAQQTTLGRLGGVVLLFRTTGMPNAPPLDTLRANLRAALPEVAIDYNTLYYTEAGPRQYFGAHLMLPAGDGPAVPIGVVDTEVGEIAALKGAQIVRRSFLGAGDTPAADGHGTAVASLIAGRDPAREFAGAAPGAPLRAAAIMRRVGDQEGTSTLLLAQALDWLLEQQVRVINLSLGGPGDALMARLIDKVTHQPGVTVVASAGNGGPDAPPSYPAAYPGVLAVTATNAADQVYGRANHGSYISLAAPGEDLWVPDQAEGHYVSGTSFAAALVSGLVGRVLARDPHLSGEALVKHLCSSAKDLGAPGPDPVYGCGLLQAAAALDAKNFADLSKKN